MRERIVFMGTASFSLAVLKMLIEEDYNIVGVVTQPDRYVGRKKVLTMPDVKVEALKCDIPVIQPARIKEDYQAVADLKPDLIITAAYGQIVPQAVLDIPRLGCMFMHHCYHYIVGVHQYIRLLLMDKRKQVSQLCIWSKKWMLEI